MATDPLHAKGQCPVPCGWTGMCLCDRSTITDRIAQLEQMKGGDASDVWIIRSEIAWLREQLGETR